MNPADRSPAFDAAAPFRPSDHVKPDVVLPHDAQALRSTMYRIEGELDKQGATLQRIEAVLAGLVLILTEEEEAEPPDTDLDGSPLPGQGGTDRSL